MLISNYFISQQQEEFIINNCIKRNLFLKKQKNYLSTYSFIIVIKLLKIIFMIALLKKVHYSVDRARNSIV